MNIYVASSWSNQYQQRVVEILRQLGHQVYDFRNPSENKHGFEWKSIDPNYQNWTAMQYVSVLTHPIVEKGFQSDYEALSNADCCILVLPSGRSAHAEAGWLKGRGKQVFVYMIENEQPELMYKLFDDIITSDEMLRAKLHKII